MRVLALTRAAVAALFFVSIAGLSTAAAQTAVAPTLIPLSGQLLAADGQPRTGAALLIISLYKGQHDTTPTWIEQQQVTLDASGQYTVQVGATLAEGLPPDLFNGDAAARWLGVAVANEAEQPRVMLVSVPYAAKAAAAETLGGKTASDFVLTSTFRDDLRTVLQEEGVSGSDVSVEAINNSLQKSNGAGGLLDSTVYDVAGNVGIGTAAPVAQLHVSGIVPEVRADRVGGALGLFRSSSTVDFGSFSSHDLRLFANSAEVMRIAGTGRVGIGTEFPQSRLHIVDSTESEFRLQITGGPLAVIRGAFGAADFGTFSGHPVRFFTSSTERIHVSASGDVGIGTTPLAKLHVAGNARVSGDVVVDGNIGAKYQDVAEWVDAAEALEPGALVTIDASATNRVKAASTAYATSVAGAVSAQPGIILGEAGEGRVLVAQSGRVKVKADAKFGAIKPGDLLVSSPTRGHLMKSKPVKVGGTLVHRPGTIVGKALEALPRGQGEILVLLTLQ